jgi:hypothetical protein
MTTTFHFEREGMFMRVSSITITKGLTLNLGQYQSQRVEVSMTAELDSGDEWTKVASMLSGRVQMGIEIESAAARSVMTEPARSLIDSLFDATHNATGDDGT